MPSIQTITDDHLTMPNHEADPSHQNIEEAIIAYARSYSRMEEMTKSSFVWIDSRLDDSQALRGHCSHS